MPDRARRPDLTPPQSAAPNSPAELGLLQLLYRTRRRYAINSYNINSCLSRHRRGIVGRIVLTPVSAPKVLAYLEIPHPEPTVAGKRLPRPPCYRSHPRRHSAPIARGRRSRTRHDPSRTAPRCLIPPVPAELLRMALNVVFVVYNSLLPATNKTTMPKEVFFAAHHGLSERAFFHMERSRSLVQVKQADRRCLKYKVGRFKL